MRSEAAKAERNARGSSADRRARRNWIVSPMAGFGGDGVKVPCVHCQAVVLKADVDIDRVRPGGSYRRSNIQPSCRDCNLARSNKAEWLSPLGVVVTA